MVDVEDMHIHLKEGVNEYNIMKKYIDNCISLGLDKVVFLDHGDRTSINHKPVLNNNVVITKFLKLIKRAKKEYKNISIYSGIEIDYSTDPEFVLKEKKLLENKFDYVLGSVHGIKSISEEEYYKRNLKLLDTYNIDILCHLKLFDDYLIYNNIINEIVKKCGIMNIKIEINTSDRSIWNFEKFNYMINLLRKYKVDYVIGSDSHKIEELYTNYDVIKSYFEKLHREIEYSIISRGTEKSGSKGYMAISKKIDGNRYLLVQNHYEKNIISFKDSLNCYNYDIYVIALSRFMLIPSLTLNRNRFKDKVIIIGFGNIGLSTLIYLLDNNYKNIEILTNNTNDYIDFGIKLLSKKYDAKLRLVDKINKEYNTYIDTTGSSEAIRSIFDNIKYDKDIFLIGTPRESKYLIDPLLIHRNNLRVIGCHELNGYSIDERNNTFKELLDKNKEKDFINKLIKISKYEEGIIEKKLDNKSNFIEVIQYDC